MIQRTHILALAAVLLLSACGSRTGDKEADGRLQQTPEINEVDVMTLRRTKFARQLLSNGRLSAASRASLAFRTTGPLSSIPVKNGQVVGAGTVLATVDRPDLRLALESAEIALAKSEIDLYDVLVGQGYPARDTMSVPSDLLETAKIRSGYSSASSALHKARYDLSGTVLRAPFRGRVADIITKRFDQAGAEPFCSLVDDSSLDVDFTVMESEYAFLSVGLPVKVSPFADPDRLYTGTVTGINPSVDKNGQVLVRARVRNDGHLVDGMNVKVTVERMLPDCLVVPRSAVVIRDNMDVLFTYTDDGKAHWTYVRILASNGDSHVVEANSDRGAILQEGDRVIISGNLNLADGSAVVLKP
ncbi:MAG: efflux RND transporter periplasmic adaptor subunit [Bacteroidales bacterium]|nr:efflux RND transporter periplasmic adaptor subunit [Bacteroidales bacterium]